MIDSGHFIRTQTRLETAPLVPELKLYLASEITPIWQATEQHLEALNIEPPFWAFAWPGSQLLARYVLDHPERVAGRHVLDFACGGGLAGLACAKAGAARVLVNDIDPLAIEAACLNASENGLTVFPCPGDQVGTAPAVDLLLCGDVCYNQQMADRIIPWLRQCALTVEVWMADPGRPYAPRTAIELLTQAILPTTMELEGKTERPTCLYRILP